MNNILFHAAQLTRCRATFHNIQNLLLANQHANNEGNGLGELSILVIFNADAVKSLQNQLSDAEETLPWMSLPSNVQLLACENSLRSQNIASIDLIDRVSTVPSGVYSIVLAQKNNYLYIRP